MAHDFKIKCIKGGPVFEAFFFGYADGIIYKSFNDEKYDKGVSGSGETSTHTWEEVSYSLRKIINSIECLTYPDQTRFDELKLYFDKLGDVYVAQENGPLFECTYF
jgi:hypothetical protein